MIVKETCLRWLSQKSKIVSKIGLVYIALVSFRIWGRVSFWGVWDWVVVLKIVFVSNPTFKAALRLCWCLVLAVLKKTQVKNV